MTFRISALPAERFAPLFSLDPATLAARNARLIVAEGGEPCRVSLADAVAGETVLLANHLHQPARSPFRSRHAIYVRSGAAEVRLAAGAIPGALASRTLSLRAFDDAGDIVAADLVDGRALAGPAEAMLADPTVAYIHAHYARYGCYAARIDRA